MPLVTTEFLGTLTNNGTMKNALINSDFDLWEYGTSITNITTETLGPNRWAGIVVGGGIIRVDQESSIVPTTVQADGKSNYSMKVSCSTADVSIASGDYAAITQKIEGYNFKKFPGKTGILTFLVRSNKTGTYCVALKNSGNDRSYVAEYTINAANIFEFKSVVIPFDFVGGTWNFTNGVGLNIVFTLSSGSTFQTTSETWQSGNYLSTSNQVNWLNSNSNVFYISQVQLELGTTFTGFERRPIQIEKNLCLRYLPYFYGTDASDPLANGQNLTTTTARIWIPFSVQLRAAPTSITVSNQTHFSVTNTSGALVACTQFAFVDATVNGAVCLATVASGLTAGYATILYGNNASTVLRFNGAEL